VGVVLDKAFFLDRDGTINRDLSYIGDPQKIELLPGAAEAIRMINEAGYLVIVVSNQSGVARGYFDTAAVDRVNARLNELLEVQGAHIDAFYYCPHLKSGIVPGYAVECDCRKPKLGLFQRAIQDYGLDPIKCFACGDRLRDVENLPQAGIPDEHLGVLDEPCQLSRYSSLSEFVKGVLNMSNSTIEAVNGS